ncbi:MAG: DNA translocase FtsK, partial [Candidatus Thioglobus sp.]
METNNKTNRERQTHSRSYAASEAVFIGLTIFGLVWIVALITHSSTENPFSSSAPLGVTVLNLAGTIGAYLSDFSFSVLGFSAYIIPISLVWLGWGVHKNAGKVVAKSLIPWLRFAATLLLIAAFSALLKNISTGNGAAGGWIGEWLDGYFGKSFGGVAIVVYLGVIMIGLTAVGGFSWVKAVISGGAGLGALFAKIRLSSAQARQKSQAKKAAKASKVAIKVASIPKSSVASKASLNKPKAQITKGTDSANLFKNKSQGALPDLALLDEINNVSKGFSDQELEQMSRQVEAKLKDFGFDITISAVTPGPVVTQFELSLAAGVKVSQIMNLSKDLARALLVESVRIVDVIPGKPVIGLEIPNAERDMIGLREILSATEFNNAASTLTIALGKDINGHPIVADLAKMPHLLVAGATGMGKSVGLNVMILSILYKATPEQVRIIMIDPKIVELSCYADIPHLLTPVITDMNQAAAALWWCVNEMERRYLLLAKFGVRNIDGFNQKLKAAKQNGKPFLDPTFNENSAEDGEVAAELEALPLIVLVVDEYADMLGALAHEDRSKAKRVEALIVRLAQKARAAGIHIIIATQRPSVDVITGLIKSNIPTRIAFKVSSKIDSRTILDQGGAEQLLGMGDMLYTTPGRSHSIRVHGAFVGDDEITRVVDFLRENATTNYIDSVISTGKESTGSNDSSATGEMDDLYDEAVQIVTSTRKASISSLQRRLRIGYNRAARIIEDMEAAGVVSTMNSAGNRQILAPEP